MNFLFKLIDKLYLKQWSIGVADESVQDVIRNKKISKKISWIPINNNHQFFADPFIFKSDSGNYCILYEKLDYNKQYGNISQFTLDNKDQIISNKVLIDTKNHLSYPFIFHENSHMYVFPEASKSGKLTGYEFNERTKTLSFKGDIINLPLVDSTILKHENKYWIFCTMRGEDSNSKLYIYHSDSLFGTYYAHVLNPVKNNPIGSRPAGNFIFVDGNIYRPAQDSGKYYGSSIIINKIRNLSEKTFEEEYCFSITPSKNEYYNFGIHTINYTGNKIVIDGLVRRFLPFHQIRKYFFNSKID